MNKQTKKAVMTKVLESWYTIDSILLGNHAAKVLSEGKQFKEYVALKGSLLSNLYEFWMHSGYTPIDQGSPNDISVLTEQAVLNADKSRALASKIINKEAVRYKIKSMVMAESKKLNTTNYKGITDKVIQEKFLQISLDNALVGLPLLESRTPDVECGFECRILEGAHKMMRDNLVRLSLVANRV